MTQPIENMADPKGQWLGILGLLATCGAILIELTLVSRPFLSEGHPTLATTDLIRSLLVALGSGMLVAWLVSRGARSGYDAESRWNLIWAGWGDVSWHPPATASASKTISLPVRQACVWLAGIASLAFVLAFLASPGWFFQRARETCGTSF